MIENQAKIIYIHDNEANSIAEWNLLHDIINTSKRAKNINSHYSPILNWYMIIIKGRVKFKNFQIILNSGFSSIIVMRRLVEKNTLKKILWRSGKHRPETSRQILKLKCILPYLHLAWRMLWRGSVMWMNPLGLGMTWP